MQATRLFIRDATLDDIPAIVAIDQESFTQPWAQRTFEDAVSDQRGISLVAHWDDVLCGYGFGWTVGDEGEITTLAVDAKFRGLSIGKQLLEAVIRECATRGVRQIFLEVRPSNSTARRLYENLGFVEVRIRRNYYQDGEDAIVMRKSVSR